MKNVLFLAFVLAMVLPAQAQEYTVVTSIESIVPMGLGRSRIIMAKQPMDYTKFTTSRTGGKDSDQDEVERSEAKIDLLDETKMLNFYSGVGINFQNVASNDAMITSKLNQMSKEGWKLVFVISGVESDAGKEDGKGIFITRYIFEKK